MRRLLRILMLCVVSYSGVLAAEPHDRQFAWRAANWQLSSAKTEADFLAAADQYRAMVADGVRNGPLFYNLGTALLNAGRHAEALRALSRAERYSGTTWETERNMQVAIARLQGTPAALPAHRMLLFWHYRLACPARAILTAVAFAMFWSGLILRALKIQRARYLIAVSLVAFALFGTSVAASVYQERRSERIFHSYQTDAAELESALDVRETDPKRTPGNGIQ